MIRNRKFLKAVAVFLCLQITSQTIFPTVSYALTSGPSQPEFSSFEPVATTNMVDEFTGDFTYNLPILEVPGPHGSGYPLSLSYHSGVTPEEEASWVGLGWTLNPGAINRNMRGLPDDFKNQPITFHNKMPRNWTVTVGGGVGFELFGKDKLGATGSASASLRYNNYRGFGYNAGLGMNLGKGIVSMGYNVSDGSGSFSLRVNPYQALSYLKDRDAVLQQELEVKYKDTPKNKDGTYSNKEAKKIQKEHKDGASSYGSSYGIFSYKASSKPNIVQEYTGKSFNVSMGIETNPSPTPAGLTVNVMGSYSYQDNVKEVTVPSYGYMYSNEVQPNSSTVMDYHVEQEKNFNPRDNFLGIPFNDADNFMVTGEGIGGGFRMYNKTIGHFGPRAVSSTVDIFNVSGEIGLGWTIGPGADLGKGSSTLSVKDWGLQRLSNFEGLSSTLDEPMFFRFNNDLGGEWGANHDDKPVRARFSGKNPTIPTDLKMANTNNERSGRSSYIGYHLNKEMIGTLANQSSQLAYSKLSKINEWASRGASSRLDLIGELTVFNESGSQYIYGLPVYAKGDKGLSYSANGVTPPSQQNPHAYTTKPNEEILVGQEKPSEYATSFLLTEILTPDYLDKGDLNGGQAGSSPDDMGGYTKFNYQRIAGSPAATDWYTWRAPYKGLIYEKNSHSDPLDNLVSYSEGEKEIYYLYSIETKTHAAIFTFSDRDDSQEALSSSDFATNPTKNPFQNNNEKGSVRLKKLDKIELFSLSDCKNASGVIQRDPINDSPVPVSGSKPIKTVHFKYSYELVHDAGTPANKLPNAVTGKLTLKRVYFEYNGITRAKISPYDFEYKYPNFITYPLKYRDPLNNPNEDLSKDYSTLSATDQNPGYNYYLSDAWGGYQKDGIDRFVDERPWIDQQKTGNKGGFDPAAWHLKVIKLPSGGEIHVQYEQDDYSYVHDQEAHVMAPLASMPVGNLFIVDLKKIGIDPVANPAEVSQTVALLTKRYITGKKKIYFKIRYSLIGAQNPDLNTCNAEYITGYASVTDVVVISASTGTVGIYLDGTQRLPDEVCREFVKTQRLGKVDVGANCNPSTGMSEPGSPKSIVNQLGGMIVGITVPEVLCAGVDETHSYFRIPTPLPKKGGGIRVKRLLMYDKGLYSGETAPADNTPGFIW